MKVNCYECKYMGKVPGSEHICCNHPSLREVLDRPELKVAALFAGVGRLPPFVINTPELNIKANPHGVKHGWFNFPFNFDPIWLENCDGFEKREEGSAGGGDD